MTETIDAAVLLEAAQPGPYAAHVAYDHKITITAPAPACATQMGIAHVYENKIAIAELLAAAPALAKRVLELEAELRDADGKMLRAMRTATTLCRALTGCVEANRKWAKIQGGQLQGVLDEADTKARAALEAIAKEEDTYEEASLANQNYAKHLC